MPGTASPPVTIRGCVLNSGESQFFLQVEAGLPQQPGHGVLLRREASKSTRTVRSVSLNWMRWMP